MERSKKKAFQPREHIASIFEDYSRESRVLRSFTNLSNTVIQTALSGQSKFVFEILQNADDAFDDPEKAIEVQFILHENYLIVRHNGKGFDYNDVERICDYASQIEEVKATDLRKTGYKGLGFKSLFNLSDCIYIHSNGYSFRFEKAYWPDPQSRPWQVIPIWCRYNDLPLHEKCSYDKPVNFILKVNNSNQLEKQLRELVNQPDLLIYLHRINSLGVDLNGESYFLERKIEKFDHFEKVNFFKNQELASTWLLKTYRLLVSAEVRKLIRGGSRFIYPDKIKNAKSVPFVFALRSDKTLREIKLIKGLCYSTLPTQLHLTLPYHINSFFILNLDRTQLHENEWNEFLMHQIGSLQLCLLRDLAQVNYLKNYVIELFVREIDHPYATFSNAFLKGFNETKGKIGWLPAFQRSDLLKLGEAWIDDVEFFKQNFQNVRDHKIYPFLIDYDLRSQNALLRSEGEVKHFTYIELFRDFAKKYYPQFTKCSYIDFITYLFERLKNVHPNSKIMTKLRTVDFLVAKDGTLLPPKGALLEESETPIPDYLLLNPVANEYLPLNNIDLIKEWLTYLGANRLMTPIHVLRESILKWVDSGQFEHKININNHIGIINYLAKGFEHLARRETEKLKKKLLILTECGKFVPAEKCYLPDAVPIRELAGVILDGEKISSTYDTNALKAFFIHIGVHEKLNPVDVFRKSILTWIKHNKAKDEITKSNYNAIIILFASQYPKIEHELTETEKTELRKMPILTCGQVFQRAQDCYFDSAIPKIKGLEHVIATNRLIFTPNGSDPVYDFLVKIGVSMKIPPIDVIRKTVLKWIQEGEIKIRVTPDNNQSILNYIAQHWIALKDAKGLKAKERDDLSRFPVLTENGTLRAARECYWQPSDSNNYDEIPGLKSVVSSGEFVSSGYRLEVNRLLEDLGVHDLRFVDIYEKYSDYLTLPVNMKWFFTQLISYWKTNKDNCKEDKLLNFVRQKFTSSHCLLAKNGNMYSSKDLYSSNFQIMHDIDKYSVPLLGSGQLPDDLEKWLGFRKNLDLRCIKQLLNTLKKKTELGEERTCTFFTMLLQQLKGYDINEIRKHELSLFDKDNKLKPARSLYYFDGENDTCLLSSCYLKRIAGMSHDDTLELAKLCGVNILAFKHYVSQVNKIDDDTLQDFYFDRLPFIATLESRERNEHPFDTLKYFYDKICSIKLYQCDSISVQYPFGYPVKTKHHFEGLTLYTVKKWTRQKTKILSYLAKALSLKTDLGDIFDVDSITSDEKQEWLNEQNENEQKFNLLEEELQKLLHKEEEKLSGKETNIKQSHHSSDEEKYLGDSELSENEELSCDESSNLEEEQNLSSQLKIRAAELLIKLSDIEHTVLESSSDDSSVDTEDEVSVDTEEDDTLPAPHVMKVEGPAITPAEKTIDVINEGILQLLIGVHGKDEAKIISCNEETPDPIREDIIDVEIGVCKKDELKAVLDESESIGVDINLLTVLGPENGCEKITKQVEIPNSFVENPSVRPSKFLPEINDEKSRMNRLSEKYVFTFLQDYYKDKYPMSQYSLLGGSFTMQFGFQKVEIDWLNIEEEKGHSYDISLRKGGDIKQLIEVKSANLANHDSFILCHGQFVERLNQIEIERPLHKEKYCFYYVCNLDNSSAACVEELINPALYKIVPLKIPSIQMNIF